MLGQYHMNLNLANCVRVQHSLNTAEIKFLLIILHYIYNLYTGSPRDITVMEPTHYAHMSQQALGETASINDPIPCSP